MNNYIKLTNLGTQIPIRNILTQPSPLQENRISFSYNRPKSYYLVFLQTESKAFYK